MSGTTGNCVPVHLFVLHLYYAYGLCYMHGTLIEHTSVYSKRPQCTRMVILNNVHCNYHN